MAEDQGEKQEEKIDFTREGEAPGYIGMDQAHVRAMQVATETPGDYGSAYSGIRMAFDVVEDRETEDHYVITLSFRPQGDFDGRPGREQFFIEQEGTVAHRQVLGLPRMRRDRFPLILATIGLGVVAAVAVGAAFAFAGQEGADGADISGVAVLPSETPVPATATLVPLTTGDPTVGVAAVTLMSTATQLPAPLPTGTSAPALSVTPTIVPTVMPSATPTLTPSPTLTPTIIPTVMPTPTPGATRLVGWYFDVTVPGRPLSDPKIRSAIDYAIDEAEIGSDFLFLPKWPSLEGAGQSYDPQRARDLLAEAGYPNGFSGLCIEPADNRADVANEVVSHLAKVSEGESRYTVTIEAVVNGSSCPAGSLIMIDTATTTVGPRAALTISPSNGPPGATVSLNGSGFAPDATVSITFDGKTVRSISVDSQGSISTTFQVPVAPGGSRSVGVGTTQSTFTVTPKLSLDRLNISPGSSVTATGVGFAANENAITVTIDQTPVKTGISADPSGSWTASLIVPSLPAGSHTAGASGSLTFVGRVPTVTLTLGAELSLEPSSGSPGTALEVRGSGFEPRESITVTVGNGLTEIGVSANSQGVWTANVTIPPAPGGRLTIRASGDASAPLETEFTVTPTVSLSQLTGSPGSSVTIEGQGFRANQNGISIRFGADIVASPFPNAQGSWTSAFTIPPSPAGVHSIIVSGGDPQLEVPFTVTPAISTLPK